MTAFEMRISDWSSDVCSSDLFSMGLTEPDDGSNSLEVRTFARRDGNGWRVNGRKIWITGVPQADKMLIVARTVPVAEAPKRTHGISLLMVDVKRQGLSHTAIDKAGTTTPPSSSVFFDHLRVEPAELPRPEHAGRRQHPAALHIGRTTG